MAKSTRPPSILQGSQHPAYRIFSTGWPVPWRPQETRGSNPLKDETVPLCEIESNQQILEIDERENKQPAQVILSWLGT